MNRQTIYVLLYFLAIFVVWGCQPDTNIDKRRGYQPPADRGTDDQTGQPPADSAGGQTVGEPSQVSGGNTGPGGQQAQSAGGQGEQSETPELPATTIDEMALDLACNSPEQNRFKGAWIHTSQSEKMRFSASLNYNCDTIFKIGSVSKNFTAVAIMQLKESGDVNLNDTIDKFLDRSHNIVNQGITIRQLLTHTSGITAEIERDPAFNSLNSNDAIEDRVLTLASNGYRKSTSRQYNSVNYLILAMIARKVAGFSDFEQYLKQHIAGPANMTRTGIKTSSLGGERNIGFDVGSSTNLLFAGGAGGIYTTPRDMFRYNAAMKSGNLISKASFDEMVQNKFGFDVNGNTASHGGAIDRLYTAMFETHTDFSQANFFAGFATDGQTRAVNIKAQSGAVD